MILWTLITGGLGYGSFSHKNARIALAVWLAFSASLYALGGPAID